MVKSYKQTLTFSQRIEKSTYLRKKHPEYIPVILEKISNIDHEILQLEKSKYLIHKDFNIGNIIYMIRKKIKLPHNKALFIIINNKFFPINTTLESLYSKEKDNDNFLYIKYSGENVFGKI